MISDKAKKVIDALSVEELRYEIERGNRSRFQRDKYAYLKVRLAAIESGKDEARQRDKAKTMKIFLSWSSRPSHEVAVAMRDWLPVVLPYVEPWVSSLDINKGARWSDEIAVQLEASDYGIICIVPGNVNEPWLNFEAGAISKTFDKAKVAPILVGVGRNEVANGPLAQFQNTVFEIDDVRQLVRSINSAHSDPLNTGQVVKAFQHCWRSLEETINAIDLRLLQNATKSEDESAQAEVDIPPESEELSEQEESILQLLARLDGHELFAEEIAGELDENLTRAKYFIKKLEDLSYISNSITMGEGIRYYIIDGGRAYLIENNLIED